MADNDGWKLFWVNEDSEVYAARSVEEARAFVEKLTGEPVAPDEVGEVVPTADMVGHNDDTGQRINMLEEWERAKADGISEPFQFWTGYL